MKKTVLIAIVLLLMIPLAISAKGEVSVVTTPDFQREFLFITTEGDVVSYSFTIINIGNETIKNKKLWYDLTPPLGSYVNKHIDITELKSGDNITLEGNGYHLSNIGDYVLQFGINSNGDKSIGNSVTVNGNINTVNKVQHSFHAYGRDQIVVVIIGAVLSLFIGLYITKR